MGIFAPTAEMFCSEYNETFDYIFKCTASLRIPKQLKDFTLLSCSVRL